MLVKTKEVDEIMGSWSESIVSRLLTMNPFDPKKAKEIMVTYMRQMLNDVSKKMVYELELKKQGILDALERETISYKRTKLQKELADVTQEMRQNNRIKESLRQQKAKMSPDERESQMRRDYEALKIWLSHTHGQPSLDQFHEMMKRVYWKQETMLMVPVNPSLEPLHQEIQSIKK